MKSLNCEMLPRPDLLKAKEILCIQPHPDDMEIGCGATLALLGSKGARVSCLTVTDGSAGTRDPFVAPESLRITRRREAERSAALLGVGSMIWLDHEDGGLLPLKELRAAITRIIRRVKPDTVFVCDPWLLYEAHSDHIRTGLAAAEACLLSHLPRFHPGDLEEGIDPHGVKTVSFYYTAHPNEHVDVSSTWELKLKAIDCHRSQFDGETGEKLKSFLTAKSQELARSVGLKQVESFKVLTPAHLHILETAWLC